MRLCSQSCTLVLLGLFGALYWRILWDMAAQWWSDPNYSHGPLVLLFSAYILYKKRHLLQSIQINGSWWGLLVLIMGLVLLAVGNIGAENYLMRCSLVVTTAGLILFHLGLKVFLDVIFPLAMLLFMIPLPSIIHYAITFPLQQFSVCLASWCLGVMGVANLVEGNIIHLAGISLDVVEACSGIRSLLALCFLAVAWAHLSTLNFGLRLVMVALVVPLVIMSNSFRLVVTGVIGLHFGQDYIMGYFHDLSGLLVFAIAMVGMSAVHWILARFAR
jgi:exosortase